MSGTCLLTAKAIDTATNGNLRTTSGTVTEPGSGLVNAGAVGERVLPVDKVGGSIHGVDDPGGFVR